MAQLNSTNVLGNLSITGNLIAAGNSTLNGVVTIANTSDASGTSASGVLLIGAAGGQHIAFDSNEIMAKSDNTTPSTLHLNHDGGVVQIGTGGLSTTGGLSASKDIKTTDGSNTITLTAVGEIVTNVTTTSGWARGWTWQHSGTKKVQMGAFGANTTFNYWFVGPAYNDTWLQVNSTEMKVSVPITRSSFTTTWVAAAKGNSFIASTASAGTFAPMLSGATTNGRMAIAFYGDKF